VKGSYKFDGYQILRHIGGGGMGEVFHARDELLHREVAIKFISGHGSNETAQKRFMVEARAIARLQHPNVVTIYRVGEVDGRPYLVSELVRGVPLNDLPTPVSSKLALEVALDLTSGLAAAHRRGVVHRDIKPANAILSDEGVVKLLDFGIAKLLDPQIQQSIQEAREPVGAAPSAPPSRPNRPTPTIASSPRPRPGIRRRADSGLTEAGATMGTPRYMAPEIWLGGAATFRSDVYSVGALLYCLCSGSAPHTTTDPLQLMQQIVKQTARPLLEVAPGVDPRLAAIIDRCLTRNPLDRFGSAGELHAALVKLTIAPGDTVVPEGNPYRGLYTFEAEHQSLFFGRDAETRAILERMTSGPFVLVAGDSGVGKSSLCRAGVLPRVGRWLDRKRTWTVVSVTPGRYPARALAVAMAPLLGLPEARLEDAILKDPGLVVHQLRARLDTSAGAVIFLDQLEELSTLCAPEERDAVAELLGRLVDPSPAVRVLASVRGDFLTRLSDLPWLGEELSRALLFLHPLKSEQIHDVIVAPARAKGVTFESRELVDKLVSSTVRAGGGLPLLQFTLAELWEAREQGAEVISGAALESLGGVAGSLSRHADQVLEQMLPLERVAARKVLLRLFNSDGTRTRLSAEEVSSAGQAMDAALASLVRGRLVVAHEGADGGGYEIAHEALIHHWDTLASWLSSDAELRRVHERLRTAAGEWRRLGGATEALWGARQLRELEELEPDSLTSVERAFVRASRRSHRRSRARRVALAVAIPLVVLLVYGVVVWRTKHDLQTRVDHRMMQARDGLSVARLTHDRLVHLRRRALTLFDQSRLPAAEQFWAAYLHATKGLITHYEATTAQLETALLLDGRRADVRRVFADVLLERALVTETLPRHQQSRELLRRLALYDEKGRRQRLWNRPGDVAFVTNPATVKVSLFRYVSDGAGRLRAQKIHGPERLRRLRLQRGSYLAVLRAPGRIEVRYPFLLHRGEGTRFAVYLPPQRSVPAGYVYVPAGRFRFGSAAEESLRRGFYRTVPLHTTRAGAFLIARHETTFADWLRYLAALPPVERARRAPSVKKGGFHGSLSLTRQPDGRWSIRFQPTSKAHSAGSDQRLVYAGRTRRAVQDWLKLPVVGVSAGDALAYAAWLRRSGRVPGARLCTEVEWERAARGADGREYPHGDTLHPDDANHDQTYRKIPAAMGPDEVGSHPASASPFGVHDLAGNVWEWTRSSLGDGKFTARGGSWYYEDNASRATNREVPEPSFRDVSVGVRVCADAPQMNWSL